MKLILLVTGGRGGSDFFQGLLDNHEQILQFPGILKVSENLRKILQFTEKKNIPYFFIKEFPFFFNSKNNFHERHNKLGKNRNEFYEVDKKNFVLNFRKLSKKEDNIYKTLVKLHQAYYLSIGKNINKCKIIFIHTHTIEYSKRFIKIFSPKSFFIIHTIRRPLNSLLSPIKNWLNFKNGSFFFPKDLYFQLDLTFKGIYSLINLKKDKKIFIVLLENLILNKTHVMKNFCKIFDIKFSKILLNCTFFGKQWWGDRVSNRWIGKNENVKNNNHNNDVASFFYPSDINYIEYLTRDIEKKYFKKKRHNLISRFKVLPLRSEILVWKNSFRHMKIKHIISIPYFYLKRVILFNSFFLEKKNLPQSIGGKCKI